MECSITNPFTIGVVHNHDDFCNRKKELGDLIRHAHNGYHVVLVAPRRTGKSSLVKRMLGDLSREGYLTASADFFPVVSEHDFVSRFARALFSGIGQGIDPRSFLKKMQEFFGKFVVNVEAGHDEKFGVSVKFDPNVKTEILLDDLMEGTVAYLRKTGRRSACVLDEFQEITSIPNYKRIEGALRAQMQLQREISFFFVGSRRRILNDMFSSRSRPFYKSAFIYVLDIIPREEFTPFIMERFQMSGKSCDPKVAGEIYDLVRGYTYYVQKLASFVWDLTEKECTSSLVRRAYDNLLSSEDTDFSGVWSGLSLSQKALLRALAEEPTSTPYGREFLQRHYISVGGTQAAIKVLLQKDLVEQEKVDEKRYRVTDPLLAAWLVKR